MRIKFGKINGFIRIYDGTRCLTLLGSENYDAIYNGIRYLIRLKSSITYIFSHYFTKLKVDSFDSLTIEKRLTLHNVIILIKSVVYKDKNHYYCKIFLEKKDIVISRTFLVQPLGYYILGEIPSNTSFQDNYSFCIDENKKILIKNQKRLLNLGEFFSTIPHPHPSR